MSIKLDLDATYAGLELFEIHRVIKKMKELGISDGTINKILERIKDK